MSLELQKLEAANAKLEAQNGNGENGQLTSILESPHMNWVQLSGGNTTELHSLSSTIEDNISVKLYVLITP